jgi:hypothetical protein
MFEQLCDQLCSVSVIRSDPPQFVSPVHRPGEYLALNSAKAFDEPTVAPIEVPDAHHQDHTVLGAAA